MHDGESSAARRPVLGGGKAVKAGYSEPAGHAPVQVTQRRVGGIFDDRGTSGGAEERRHVGKLSEQVDRDDRGELPARGFQGLGIHGQELRVHIDEDRPVAGSHDGPDQRRIGKQGEGDARSGFQIERSQQEAQRLPAAAGPELRAVAKQSERLGRRSAAENRQQCGREIRRRVGQGEPGNGV